MGTVPVPYTWVHGEIPNFREQETRLADMLTFLMNPPMVRLRKTTAQTISSSTSTAVSWNSVEVETENMWDSTAPTRLKPSTPGWYLGTFGASFAANATGYREFDIQKNGSSSERAIRVKFDAFSVNTIGRGTVFLESFNGVSDYIECLIWQNSGGSLGIDASLLETQPDVTLRWFCPL